MAATNGMRRATWAVAVVVLWVGAAHAGAIRGTLEVPAVAPSGELHPYPGRAGSMPTAGTAVGSVTDAVIYVARISGAPTPVTADAEHPALAQRQQAFVPRVLAVQAGTTVDFPNFDPVFHNVFSVSPTKRFDLGKYARGHSRSLRFNKAGLVNVYCDIHSDMAAYILVLPHHVFTRPSAAGRFALPTLPPGPYTLVVWHPDLGEIRRDLQVPSQGDAVVDLRY